MYKTGFLHFLFNSTKDDPCECVIRSIYKLNHLKKANHNMILGIILIKKSVVHF